MKFLNKDILSSLLLGLFISMSSSAVLAAGGGAGQSGSAGMPGGGSSMSHKMEQPKVQNQYEHQKGQGGDAAKGEQTGEGEQAQTQEQNEERVQTTIQSSK